MPVFNILFLTAAAASPVFKANNADQSLRERQDNSSSLLPYSLPPSGPDGLRAADITTKQLTFTYGPAVGGIGPYSPTGALGTSYVTVDSAIDDAELGSQVKIMTLDDTKARLDTAKVMPFL